MQKDLRSKEQVLSVPASWFQLSGLLSIPFFLLGFYVPGLPMLARWALILAGGFIMFFPELYLIFKIYGRK